MDREEEEANGLSLESLAQRLEALQREHAEKLQTLERENERMRSENAELRSKVATLEGSGTRMDEIVALRDSAPRRDQDAMSRFAGQVSRRSLLSKAGAAAVAAVAAGGLLARDARVAKASHLDPGISVDYVITHLDTPNSTAVFGHAPNGEGVVGLGGVYGVRGQGQTGVFGKNSTGGGNGVVGDASASGYAGVLGTNSGGSGVKGVGNTGVQGESSATDKGAVHGQHTGTSGHGVIGDGKGTGAGVLGRNGDGTGVEGNGKTGVLGKSATSGSQGVHGQHTGTAGYGVVGDGAGSGNAGVLGRNSNGSGVKGEGVNGVQGKATSGYGGFFEGGKAQLKITPKGSAGRPTAGAHVKGEIYMDSGANLFVCTVSGTPGTWRKVSTTAVT